MSSVVDTASASRAAVDELDSAVVRTVAYADVFSFAPTIGEIHRYLIGMRATELDLHRALARRSRLAQRLAINDGHVTLPGRQALIGSSSESRRRTASLLPRARRYARAVGSLPFVRMVAITGGVAAGNVGPDPDIDLFIVTERGHVWLARATSLAIVRYAGRQGDEVCPNYLLSNGALALEEQDLYTAQEIARMQPIVGQAVYARLREANPWTARFLPNAAGPPAGAIDGTRLLRRLRRPAEAAMSSAPWRLVEAWEQRRKIARFSAMAVRKGLATEALFTADRCKGHFLPYRTLVRDAYETRCRAAGVDPA